MMRITPDIRMLGKMTMTQQKCLLKEEQLESASIWLEKGATTCLRNEHFPMVHSTLSKGKRMNVKANKFNLEITQMRLMKFIIGLMIVILAMSKRRSTMRRQSCCWLLYHKGYRKVWSVNRFKCVFSRLSKFQCLCFELLQIQRKEIYYVLWLWKRVWKRNCFRTPIQVEQYNRLLKDRWKSHLYIGG